jgi:MFS family permease
MTPTVAEGRAPATVGSHLHPAGERSCGFAGRIADRAGRRPTVLGTAALFVAGVMLAAFSPSYGVLVGARVITGLLTQTPATATTTARAATAALALPAGDGPPGFWWGTDSLPVTVPGSAPYQMPYLGGAYGGYIGMTGNWAYWLGCKGGFIAFSATDNAGGCVG